MKPVSFTLLVLGLTYVNALDLSVSFLPPDNIDPIRGVSRPYNRTLLSGVVSSSDLMRDTVLHMIITNCIRVVLM